MRLLLLLAGLVAFSGCETKQASTTYWTTKAGVVTVHHVVGTVDQTEKLTQKRLTNEEIAAYKLPKGTYFKVEPENSDSPVTAAKAEAKNVIKSSGQVARLRESARLKLGTAASKAVAKAESKGVVFAPEPDVAGLVSAVDALVDDLVGIVDGH